MKIRFPFCFLAATAALTFLFSCESKPTEKATPPAPQVFTSQPETDSITTNTDSLAQPEPEMPETTEMPAPEVKREPMPTVQELKKITPSQEAKRALSNDAMQAYRMQPEAFYKFLQGRIPYYRDKGHLKTENDLVRIEITETKMKIETAKGSQTFPMQ